VPLHSFTGFEKKKNDGIPGTKFLKRKKQKTKTVFRLVCIEIQCDECAPMKN